MFTIMDCGHACTGAHTYTQLHTDILSFPFYHNGVWTIMDYAHACALAHIQGDDAGSSRVLLHQQYLGFIELESELLVRTAPDGRISAFEERW